MGYIALGYIILMALVAVFGYFIIPDPTSNANGQHVEIALQKPGFECKFLEIPIPSSEKVSFFSKLLYGEPLSVSSKAIYSYYFSKDSLYIEAYTGLMPNSGHTEVFDCWQLQQAWQQQHGKVQISSEIELEMFITSKMIVKKKFI